MPVNGRHSVRERKAADEAPVEWSDSDVWVGWHREHGCSWTEAIRGHSREWVEAWGLRNAMLGEFAALHVTAGPPQKIMFKVKEVQRGRLASERSPVGVAKLLGCAVCTLRRHMKRLGIGGLGAGKWHLLSESEIEALRAAFAAEAAKVKS